MDNFVWLHSLENKFKIFKDFTTPGCGACIRNWSLITGRGGYKTDGGHVMLYPVQKGGAQKGGGAEKVLAILKGGGHKKF